MPDTSYSWIPILTTLQAVEHGTQLSFARCLVFVEAVRFARQVCYASRETFTPPRGEYAPAQEPVGVFEAQVSFPAFEKALQKRVQCFCLLQREPQHDGGFSVQASGLSPGRSCPA
jgi:hypothetical protein